MVELATGKHPYEQWKTPFEQLKQVQEETLLKPSGILYERFCCKVDYIVLQVVQDDPPRLPAGVYSEEFEHFITNWYLIIEILNFCWRNVL